jgi:hypothetical protein
MTVKIVLPIKGKREGLILPAVNGRLLGKEAGVLKYKLAKRIR